MLLATVPDCLAGPLDTVVDAWQHYQESCPIAPYTWYVVLGFLGLLFFYLWRRAASQVTYVTAQAVAEKAAYDPPQLLETVRQISANALETVRYVQSDSLQKLQAAHESSLQHIAAIVASFNADNTDE
jgi:hypothetical protein